MPLPSRLLLLLVACCLGLALLQAFAPEMAPIAGYAGAAVLLLAVVDAVLLVAPPRPRAVRRVAASLPVGVWRPVRIRIDNPAMRAIRLTVADHFPAGFEAENQPAVVTVPSRGWAEIGYRLRATERGEAHFGPIGLRLLSPLGLIEWQSRSGEPRPVRVYPDFAALTRYALLATDHRLSQIGVLQRRSRGEGMDFAQLREYRQGDSLRRIDWKATSRMGKPISREYQAERDQSIVLLIDCGRRMATRDGPTSHFDAALDAALLLAYVGLRQGDAVGAMTMGGSDARFVAPRKSTATVTLLLHRLYDLQPTLRPPDYHAAAVDLMRRVGRRALVIVLSNLRDEDDDSLVPALALLARRHLVLFANLREQILGRALATHVSDLDRALTHAATAEYLSARAAAFRRLERAGARLIDVEPPRLPLALVNRYLDIKRSGVL